ncbi:MAG TPA: ATP-binding protein, partial [Actinomycetota bacterium]|nr:ATP-binding protein [Actinomycetota bacterium]
MAKRTTAPTVRAFPARATSLASIRRFIEQRAAEIGVPRSRRQDIVLAVTEGCSNAIRHTTTAEVTVSWEADSGLIVVYIADDGIFRRPSPPPAGIGGFGIPLMRALADELAIREGTQRRPGTIVRLTWRLGEPRLPPAGGAPAGQKDGEAPRTTRRPAERPAERRPAAHA